MIQIMLPTTNYAQNYASKIGKALVYTEFVFEESFNRDTTVV